MKYVRQEIGHQLIDALHQCNMALVTDTNDDCNDLNTKCSCRHEAYGSIGDALTSLGFNRAREVYASQGSVRQAHMEIDEQYPVIQLVAVSQ